MIVTDLNGVQSEWKFKGRKLIPNSNVGSALHKAVRKILYNKYPTLNIIEEVSIKVERGKTLYLDFYLPMRQTAIEVNGEQHYKYSSLFHSSALEFVNQKKNDIKKQRWCEINDISLISLKFDEQDKWEDKL